MELFSVEVVIFGSMFPEIVSRNVTSLIDSN